jgi:hypothetical protein
MNATHPSKSLSRRKILWTIFSERVPENKRPGRHRKAGQHTNIFLPGQAVLESGIYEVIHDRTHRASHEAVMHREDLFPVCDQCDTRVRFKLVRTAPYIFDDEDFIDEK